MVGMKRLLATATVGLMLLAACGGSASVSTSSVPPSAASAKPSAPASASAASSSAAPASASAKPSAAASTAPASSASAAPAASGVVSITFWHTQTGANQQTLNDLVAKFN